MDKDSSWIETWSDGKIGFQPRYFATSAAVIIIGLTEKGEAEFQNSFLLRNNSIRNSLSLSLSRFCVPIIRNYYEDFEMTVIRLLNELPRKDEGEKR